ncbi:hypothetical protein Goarm_016686, partial [Gossypium armourianum]|nr:hypothetical protein [Gossypium armourianum]
TKAALTYQEAALTYQEAAPREELPFKRKSIGQPTTVKMDAFYSIVICLRPIDDTLWIKFYPV